MKKNILVFGASSEIASMLINKLLKLNNIIYAVHRSPLDLTHENLYKFQMDLTDKQEINNLFLGFGNTKFDCIICFQGVAISCPVEYLKKDDLQKQLDISLFSLAAILANLHGRLTKTAKIINISSMACFGIFPYLAPYSLAKAACDILLFCYEIENGIKTVSVKPGVIGTKFWKYCISQNNFENFACEHKNAAEFLKANALKNSKRGLSAEKIAHKLQKIIYDNNPKSSYLIGNDAYFAAFISHFKSHFLAKIIRFILKKRIGKFNNG